MESKLRMIWFWKEKMEGASVPYTPSSVEKPIVGSAASANVSSRVSAASWTSESGCSSAGLKCLGGGKLAGYGKSGRPILYIPH